jgi:type IV secretory pathway VirD2 relaxase
MKEDDVQVRLGRIRSRGVSGPKTFVGVALAAASRAGGLRRSGPRRDGAFGRGRARALQAAATLGGRARRVVVKARVVRHLGRGAPLAVHLSYLQREGVTEDGEKGRLFAAEQEVADGRAFASRCENDRHHFRFIVAPEDAEQLLDLKAFTRDLMAQAERDLGTRLDWVAVAHWNTGHPHLHVIVRGRTDQDEDLVISRDYIGEGLRARAGELATLELGPRTDAELRRQLSAQIGADRWTPLDRSCSRLADADGVVDLRRPAEPGHADPPGLHSARVGRMRRLQTLGLAHEVAAGRWRVAPEAEATLRAIAQRQDIIARMHRALSGAGLDRDPARFVLDAGGEPLVGRLAARGLDDELRGSGYAVIDGLDGRTHHLSFADLADASDAPLGAIVALRPPQRPGRAARPSLQVQSDLGLAEQVAAPGCTWLDRQLVGRTPAALGEGGFADEVRQALQARTEHLEAQGLAQRQGRRIVFARGLLDTLRQRELAAAEARLARQTGLEPQAIAADGALAGTYRQRLNLASGRFAMIESGLGFSLAPWRPDLERRLGQQVSGVMQPGGAVSWSFTNTRGLGL